jgi:hypothetical protein
LKCSEIGDWGRQYVKGKSQMAHVVNGNTYVMARVNCEEAVGEKAGRTAGI